MGAYIVRRLIQAIIVIAMVVSLLFVALRIMPGDPILLYVSEEDIAAMTDEEMEALRHEFGLDKPMVMQFADYVSGLFHGDLGTSIKYRQPVANLILRRLPRTIHLGIMSFVVSGFLGILGGLICALRRGKWQDTVTTFWANIGITIPIFWLGLLMIYGFGLKLGWLPIQGYTYPWDDFWLNTRQIIMPVFCMSIFAIAGTTRLTRSSMLEVVRQDYIRTAWSKGLTERSVVVRHALKNGLIPVVTVMGAHVAGIFGGSVFIETVFNIPGIGRLMVQSVFSQDYAVAQSAALLMGTIVVLTNLVVDISWGWLDPRIRYG